MNAALALREDADVAAARRVRFPHASWRQLILAVILLLVAGVVAYLTVSRVTAGPQSFSGTLVDSGSTTLDFPSNGAVSKVLVHVGEKVTVGEALATQAQQYALVNVTDAKAVLAADKAKLTSLTNPALTSTQQQQINLRISKAQAQVQAAQTAAQDAASSAASQVAQAQQAATDSASVVTQDKARFSTSCPHGVVVPPSTSPPSAFSLYEGCVNLQSQLAKDSATAANDQANLTHTQSLAQQIRDTANSQVTSDQAALQLAQNESAVQSAPANPAEVSSAQADVAQAQSQLDQAQQALAALTLYAPMSGVVVSIGGSTGSIDGPNGVHVYAGPTSNQSSSSPGFSLFPTSPSANSTNNSNGSQQPLFTIDSSSYSAIAQVTESEVTKLHEGSPGRVTINALNKTVPAVVANITPIPVHGLSSVQYDVGLTAGDWPAYVLPGMSVSVTFG
jgi:multidrug efflux pump subunit AcrA (membrane-fusion protein)